VTEISQVPFNADTGKYVANLLPDANLLNIFISYNLRSLMPMLKVQKVSGMQLSTNLLLDPLTVLLVID